MGKIYNMESRRFYEIEDVLKGTKAYNAYVTQGAQLLRLLGNSDYLKKHMELFGNPHTYATQNKTRYRCYKPGKNVRILVSKDLISFQVRRLDKLQAFEAWARYFAFVKTSLNS